MQTFKTIGLQLVLAFVGNQGLLAQSEEQTNDQVILVQVLTEPPLDAYQALSVAAERSRVVFTLNDGQLLLPTMLTEPVGEFQESIGSAGCFFANLKLVYRDYTYVVSTYCTDARKFENESPYQAGKRELINDLVFTEELLTYLAQVQQLHFKPDFAELYQQLAPYYVAPAPAALPDSVWLVPEFEQYLNQDLADIEDRGVDPAAEDELETDADQTIDYNYHPLPQPADEDLMQFEGVEDDLQPSTTTSRKQRRLQRRLKTAEANSK
jgi:hypothetical protein